MFRIPQCWSLEKKKKEEKLYCRSFPFPKCIPKCIHPSSQQTFFEKPMCAALYQGLWREERCGKQNAEEIENAALLKPLPVHLLSPTYSPALLWGLDPEWKDRRERRNRTLTPPALRRDEFGLAYRHLPLRFPGSYLRGEAVYR